MIPGDLEFTEGALLLDLGDEVVLGRCLTAERAATPEELPADFKTDLMRRLLR